MKKRIIACFLLTLCLLTFLCSCGISSELLAEADANVKLYLDNMVERDRDALYDLLYPGVIEREDFDEVEQQMAEYCPITKGYQIRKKSFEVTSSIGNPKKKTVKALYDLRFEGNEYELTTEYTEAGAEHGFTVFRVSSSVEYEAGKKQKK